MSPKEFKLYLEVIQFQPIIQASLGDKFMPTDYIMNSYWLKENGLNIKQSAKQLKS